MRKSLFSVAAFLLLVSAGSLAQAQSLKIGYTDHEVIIANMPEYRQLRQQLQQEYEKGQAELQTQFKEYQDKLDKYQKQQALLSAERRQEREQELGKLQADLQQAAQQKEQGLAEREAELMGPILEKVQVAIDEVAQAKGLDLVLRSQAGPMQPILLYRNEKTIVDITPDVARKLGLKVEDSTAAN